MDIETFRDRMLFKFESIQHCFVPFHIIEDSFELRDTINRECYQDTEGMWDDVPLSDEDEAELMAADSAWLIAYARYGLTQLGDTQEKLCRVIDYLRKAPPNTQSQEVASYLDELTQIQKEYLAHQASGRLRLWYEMRAMNDRLFETTYQNYQTHVKPKIRAGEILRGEVDRTTRFLCVATYFRTCFLHELPIDIDMRGYLRSFCSDLVVDDVCIAFMPTDVGDIKKLLGFLMRCRDDRGVMSMDTIYGRLEREGVTYQDVIRRLRDQHVIIWMKKGCIPQWQVYKSEHDISHDIARFDNPADAFEFACNFIRR